MAKLAEGVRRNLVGPYDFRVFSPDVGDLYLTTIPGCFARLRMFDPEWQAQHGLSGRLVNLDLDLVVTGSLDGLFDGPAPFQILQGANASNPCPYNGSVFALDCGAHPEVWSDFTLEAARAVPHFEFPDDQAWLAAKVPGAGGWTAGPDSGIYAFQKPGWPRGEALPRGAKMVAFPGWRDPVGFQHLDWVRDHWKA